MREIRAFEARKTLSSLLDEVQQGGEVLIARYGKPAARLVAPGASIDRSAAQMAAAQIIERSRGKTLNGLTIRELIDEGRP